MSDVFFETLGIRKPDFPLRAGSGTHAEMTGRIMIDFEKVVREVKPNAVIVYGDTDTTLAGALVAAKEKIPLVHVEAGVRMKPRTMPEEINRVVCDRIADVLFCPSKATMDALKQESVPGEIFFVGDVMLDLFLLMSAHFSTKTLSSLKRSHPEYIVVTLHREANVDDPKQLKRLLQALGELSKFYDIVFPIHPRTQKRVSEFYLDSLLAKLLILAPVDYLNLMGLVRNAAYVVTDSGGLQKEAYFARKRAFVLLEDAGWRELIECGWNILSDAEHLVAQICDVPQAQPPDQIYGSGDAGQKIVDTLKRVLT